MYLQRSKDTNDSECARIMGLIRHPQYYLQLDLRQYQGIVDVSALAVDDKNETFFGSNLSELPVLRMRL